MRKSKLGLDIGTNSIGWAIVDETQGYSSKIIKTGSRILPMTQDVLGKFDSGQSLSQTAERTGYRGTRRLYQRENLRRERLHRVLNVLGFLPEHYGNSIDFEKALGQFKPGVESKLNYEKQADGSYRFVFMNAFEEMVKAFQAKGHKSAIPYDWTIYFLRDKALRSRVSKEELAWLLLHFNQKRGYYQLRGEDIDVSSDKQYMELLVASVLPTGESVNGKPLHQVTFENGLEYNKLIVKTDDWLGRKKEFIVTTKTLSSGEVKHTFKEVDSEADWTAIKAKTEQDIESSGKTVGTYMYHALLNNPNQKLRGKLVKTIERKFYKQELIAILRQQIQYHPELQSKELYKDCLEELYPRNEAHKNTILDKAGMFEYLFLEDIIFYQRPLKSKKSSIGNCQFETRFYIDKQSLSASLVKQPLKAISKSHPLFQEFRLVQWFQNLRIYNTEVLVDGNDTDVTDSLISSLEQRGELLAYLMTKPSIEEKNIIDYLVKKKLIEKADKQNYRWNYVQDKSYPAMETRSSILQKLAKVEGVKDATSFLSADREVQLWHIIYSVTDKFEYKSALETFASKQGLNVESFTAEFGKFPPFKSDFASYSEKAIKKLLPLMRFGSAWSFDNIHPHTQQRIANILTGELDEAIKDNIRDKAIHLSTDTDFQNLPLHLASYIVYDRHSESGDIQHWKSPSQIDDFLQDFKQHSLRNPIVEKVVTETLRVVRDIWLQYGNGEPDFFESIHVELGREMKNPAGKRQDIAQRNNENENTNTRIKLILEELQQQGVPDVRAFSPSHQEILKLYEEGVSQNPDVQYQRMSEDEVQKIRRTARPTRAEITKYKLWLEQGYLSPYTGKPINLSRLFTRDYEIEHIIPQSRYYDNSLSNKVICESTINQDKNNATALAYLKAKGGSIVNGHKLLTLEAYELHVSRYFKSNRSKLRNLLSEDIPEGFINRQLNDTRYISKFVTTLLSNIVRKEDELGVNSVNVLTLPGAITSKLKYDWGLEDKWNEIVAPRFERLNAMTKSTDFGEWDTKINAFRTSVPDEVQRGFNKKRIDHRHHALDALVIACTDRRHVQYLNSLNNEKTRHNLQPALLIQNENGHYTKTFKLPWPGFVSQAKAALETTVVSFKQNTRVINKTNNKTWQWQENDGILKKALVKQTKGDNWAIRKPLHKDTVSGKINMDASKGKIATASRTDLSSITSHKHIEKVTDISIQKILVNHAKRYVDDKGTIQYDLAFNPQGVERLNADIVSLNGGKHHHPIYKVRLYEVGSKFPVGTTGAKATKYVEAAKGTNLFFAIYWDEKKQKRAFESIPLNEVIEHQKQVAHLPSSQRTPITPNPKLGKYLYTLSPNDLVYVPTNAEIEQPNTVDFAALSPEQCTRIYKMVSCTGSECHFIPNTVAKEILKNENGTNSKSERIQINNLTEKGNMIKEICWKLQVDRLGRVTNAHR